MSSKTSSGNANGNVSPTTKQQQQQPSSVCASGHILLVSMQKLRNPAFQRFGADLRKTLMITSVVKQARKFYQLGSDVPVNCGCVRAESFFVLPLQAMTAMADDVVSVDVAAADNNNKVPQTPSVSVSTADGEAQAKNPRPPTSPSRKHSLSLLRKNRGPKKTTLTCAEPVVADGDQSACSPHHRHDSANNSHSHHHHHHHHHHSNNNNNNNNQNHNHNSHLNNNVEPAIKNDDDHPPHCPATTQRDETTLRQSWDDRKKRLHLSTTATIAVASSPEVVRYLQCQADDTPPVKKRRLAFLHEPNAICITATVC